MPTLVKTRLKPSGRSQAAVQAQIPPLLEPAMALGNALPVDLLQSLFALLDPWGVAGKYRSFARLPQDGRRARLFVALEDWLNDGIPLAAEVTRACLRDWYGANTPFRGDWRIAGLAGLLVATLAIMLPSCTLAFVAARALARWSDHRWIALLKAGLVPVALGLILASGVSMMRAADRTMLTVAISLATATFVVCSPRNPLWALAAASGLGILALEAGLAG